MAPLLLVGLLFGDVAPPMRPEPATSCTRDDECVISTTAGCCAVCPAAPFATSRADAQRRASTCAVVDCAGPGGKPRCRAVADAGEFKAVCSAGQCVATRVTPEPLECRADSDCASVVAQPPPGAACHSSACGCCPVLVAAPVKLAAPPPGPRPPSSEERPKPASPYGLSTGQPAPSCAPCPAPAPNLPRCSGGKCVIVPIHRPHPVG